MPEKRTLERARRDKEGATRKKGNRRAHRQASSFGKRSNTFARGFMGLAPPSRPSRSACPRRGGPASNSSHRALGRPPRQLAVRPRAIRDVDGHARIGPRRREPTPPFGLSSERATVRDREKRSPARREARRHVARRPPAPRRPAGPPQRRRTNAPSAAGGRVDRETQSHGNPSNPATRLRPDQVSRLRRAHEARLAAQVGQRRNTHRA